MDEAFWQAQQARRERGFGQPCCTQSGMSWKMIDVPGNFAVVIHGEFDCVSCFHHQVGRSATRYYSTRLSEAQLVAGDTAGPLRRCLRAIAEGDRPVAVLVLGTCPVEVIGDRFETVVKAVSEETGVPMLPLHTHGLKLLTQADMLDWLYETLSGLSTQPDTPKGLNLVGLPRPDAHLLSQLGDAPWTAFPDVDDFADWGRIGHARAALAVDRAMTPRLVKQLTTRFGQEVVDVPYPLGVAASLAVHRAVADLLGSRPPAVPTPRPFEGRRFAVGVGMMNTYGTLQVAHAGLSEANALAELGFEVTLLVQGAPEAAPQVSARVAGAYPFHIFPGPWALVPFLEGYDLCCLSDSSHEEARRAGVPMLPSGSLQPWLSGVEANITRIEALLRPEPTPP